MRGQVAVSLRPRPSEGRRPRAYDPNLAPVTVRTKDTALNPFDTRNPLTKPRNWGLFN